MCVLVGPELITFISTQSDAKYILKKRLNDVYYFDISFTKFSLVYIIHQYMNSKADIYIFSYVLQFEI